MPMTTTCFVLDTYAFMAFLREEPTADEISNLFERAARNEIYLAISMINYGEICYIVERTMGLEAVEHVIVSLDAAPIIIFQATRKRVLAAAHIKARYPLSYADAFAVALAQELQATVVTGDPEFHAVEHLVNVLWLEEPL